VTNQVEGRQAVRELLRAGKRRVERVTIAAGAAEKGVLAEIVDLARAAGVPVRTVDRDEIDGRSLTDSPQGVIALAQPLREFDVADLLKVSSPFLVVLDGVTDPHNLGAVMRSALCAGATGLVIARHRSAAITPAAVKAAAGAAEHLPVAHVGGVPATLSTLSGAGVWTVGLDSAGPTSLWELGVATEPLALVLGAEGSGLGRLTRQRCEVLVSIPLTGPIESLNVSAAAALACFEVARKRSSA